MRAAAFILLLVPHAVLAQEPAVEDPDAGTTFTVVETMPQFPGGEAALFKYLERQVVYPKEAIEAGAQGTVYVMFTVMVDGRVDEVEVLRGVHPAIDAETVRVVSSMPNWKPGTQRGKAVKVKYTMPVRYSLPKARSKKAARKP